MIERVQRLAVRRSARRDGVERGFEAGGEVGREEGGEAAGEERAGAEAEGGRVGVAVADDGVAALAQRAERGDIRARPAGAVRLHHLDETTPRGASRPPG